MNERKVIMRVKGGLGNQMFGYAAARRLAVNNDAELVMDEVTWFANDWQWHAKYELHDFPIAARLATSKERREPFSWLRRAWVRRWERRKPFHRRRYAMQESNVFEPGLLSLEVDGTVYVEGIWPSEEYFKDIGHLISCELVPNADIGLRNTVNAEIIQATNPVAVHMRFFRNPNTREFQRLTGYYCDSIRMAKAELGDPTFFLFTDNIDLARGVLLDLTKEGIEVHQLRGERSGIDDLWLMTLCTSVITAGSTFSWWGAWLAENRSGNRQGGPMFAPDRSFFDGVWWASEGSRSIPDRWVTLTLDEYD